MEQQTIAMTEVFRPEKQQFLSDLDIVHRAVTGDSEAFLGLYKQNLPRIYAVCLRITADREEADEVTQQALVRTWEMLDTYRGESPLSAWIHRIAVNVTLDYLRSRHNLNKRIQFTDDLEIYDNSDTSSSREIQIDIEQAIATLPAQARAVIVLHYIEGYSHSEISGLLGIAIGTSKAHLHAARRLLKEVLGR
ncbi:MAG: RNA polymerase sigma factor [Bacteroidetes bacterium]|nr:RNA polymerase sigma factor [Bacteroidota bacterium]